MTVMIAESRLIALLRLEVHVLLLYQKIKQMFMGENELFCFVDTKSDRFSLSTVPLLQE